MLCGRCEEEFFVGSFQASEPEASQAKMSFQMSKQHLNLFASSSALVMCGRVLQGADGLAGMFVHVARDGSEWRVGTGFADRTRATCFFTGVVTSDPVVFLYPAQRHLVAFEAGEAVPLSVILEMVDIIFAVRLMLAVEDRDVRRDITIEQPGQKRPGAI